VDVIDRVPDKLAMWALVDKNASPDELDRNIASAIGADLNLTSFVWNLHGTNQRLFQWLPGYHKLM
jgi:hypothetical protein